MLQDQLGPTVRDTATTFFSLYVNDRWGEYTSEIEEAYNDAVTEFIADTLPDYSDVTHYEGTEDQLEDIADAFSTHIVNDFQAHEDHGSPHEWSESNTIYHSDIWAIYHHNESECDEYLGEIALDGVSSLSEIASYLVGMYASGAASGELYSASQAVEVGQDEFLALLKDAAKTVS